MLVNEQFQFTCFAPKQSIKMLIEKEKFVGILFYISMFFYFDRNRLSLLPGKKTKGRI